MSEPVAENPDDFDDLVPLFRKKLFHPDLQSAAASAVDAREPLALVMLDGDGFKQVNDDHGHPIGDEVLKELGEVIRRRCRRKGRGYRFGGDEFGIILENCGSSEAAGLAEDLRREVERALLSSKELRLTITQGVAAIPDHAPDAATLLERADEALRRAKLLGRNRVCLPESVTPRSAGQGGRGGVPDSGVTSDYASRVLVSPSDGRPCFIPSERIEEEGDRVHLDLIPEDAKQSSLLSDLGQDRPVGIAYGLTALYARPAGATRTWEKGRERWRLSLKEHASDYGDSFVQDMAVGELSADDLARMRARRILLDEATGGVVDASVEGFNNALLELYVRGFNTPIEVDRSPLPSLAPLLEEDPAAFLAAARLVAVLFLRLSRAVEQVWRLDLRLLTPGKLEVRFEGRRARRYSNQEPAVITVEGVCDLTGASS